MTAWTNFPWELKKQRRNIPFLCKRTFNTVTVSYGEHWTILECYFETEWWKWLSFLIMYFFTKYWKAKTEYDRTPGRSCFIFFCHSHNNGVLMTLRGFETIPHQRPRGSPRHKMGHFLEWLKVWGLHLLIFENSVTSFMLRLNVFESHGTSKASAPQLLHCELCLIAWHVVTGKG